MRSRSALALRFHCSARAVFKRIIFVILLAVIVFNVGSTVWKLRSTYFSSNYNASFLSLQKIYYDSIYKNKHGGFVPDEVLYSYIGGALMKGKSPIFLNPEVPPLGTYIIGLSTVVFNNQYIVIVLFAALSLYLIYLVGLQIYSSRFLALIPPLLFSFEPIFKNQLVYAPLLDIIQLTFLLSIFYFFNKALHSKNNFLLYIVLVNIFFDCFISTKFFGTGITVAFAVLFPLAIHKEWRRLMTTLITMPIAVIILYANYLKVLIDGYPLNKFLGIQKWILIYNEGHLMKPFSIWPLLLFNKWYQSFGKQSVSSDPQWLISWPFITIISLITIVISFIKKISKREVEIMFFWIISYLLLMSFVDASTRYFVILIPILYMIALYGIIEFVKVIKK